jgi:hypothetical protein
MEFKGLANMISSGFAEFHCCGPQFLDFPGDVGRIGLPALGLTVTFQQVVRVFLPINGTHPI